MTKASDRWLYRLGNQLTGWHIWYSGSGGNARGWYAVPAPPDVAHIDALNLSGKVGPHPTPQALRSAVRAFYGWNDTCDCCGVLARECGHGSPETGA